MKNNLNQQHNPTSKTLKLEVGIMASIYKRKNENGTAAWRAVVSIKGYPNVYNHFDRKQEAEDWAANIERQIKAGQFNFDQYNEIRTFEHLIER